MRQVWVGKVSDKQTTVSVAKELDGVKTGVFKLPRDKPRGYLFTVWAAFGVEVARARRGLFHGTWEPYRSCQGKIQERQYREGRNTDGSVRGGTSRSSDEASVMEGERRGRITRQ